MKHLRLNLGSSSVRLDGYMNLGVDLAEVPDLVLPIARLPFKSNSVSEILTHHDCGYTPQSLTGLLVRVGFINVEPANPQTQNAARNLRIIAEKPHKVRSASNQHRASKRTPRIFWMLRGSRQTASSRIHGYLLHEYLISCGWKSFLLVEPFTEVRDIPLSNKDLQDIDGLLPNDVVVIQKFRGVNTQRLLEWCAEKGIITIYVDSDLPIKHKEASLAMYTVCPSITLTREYRKAGHLRAFYIPDAVEKFEAPKVSKETTALRCAWFGNWTPSKAKEVEFIRDIIEVYGFDDIELVVISNHKSSNIRWQLDTFFDELHACDFAVFPTDNEPDTLVKSANRVLQSMALGLPVIANPLPSYIEVIHSGYNGYICSTVEDWVDALRQMRDSKIRDALGKNGYQLAREFFSIDTVGTVWQDFFSSISSCQTVRRGNHVHPKFCAIKRLRARAFANLVDTTSKRKLQARYLASSFKEAPVDNVFLRKTLRFTYNLVYSRIRTLLKHV